MAGMKVLLRTTEDYNLVDPLWLGEGIIHKTEFRFGFNNGVVNCWLPHIDPDLGTLILGQGSSIFNTDTRDERSIEINFDTPDAIIFSNPIDGVPYASFNPTSSDLTVGTSDSVNVGAPSHLWRSTSSDSEFYKDLTTVVSSGNPSTFYERIPNSSFIVWGDDIPSNITLAARLTTFRGGAWIFPNEDKTDPLGISQPDIITQRRLLQGDPTISVLVIDVETADGEWDFTNIGVRTHLTDRSILDKKLYIYYSVAVKDPTVAAFGIPFSFSSRVGFGENFVSQGFSIPDVPYYDVIKLEYDPSRFTEQERGSGNLTIDLIYDVFFERNDTISSEMGIRITECWVSDVDLEDPLAQFKVSISDPSLSIRESMSEKHFNKSIVMRGNESAYYNFPQKMYSNDYDVIIHSSDNPVQVVEKTQDGFELKSTSTSSVGTWTVEFSVVPSSTTNVTF